MNIGSCLIISDCEAGAKQLEELLSSQQNELKLVCATLSDGSPAELYLLYQPIAAVIDLQGSMEDTLACIGEFYSIIPDIRIIAFGNATEIPRFGQTLLPKTLSLIPRPVSPPILREQMEIMVASFHDSKQKNASPPVLQQIVESNVPILRQHYLSMLLHQRMPEGEDFAEKFRALQINCPGPYYTAILFDIVGDTKSFSAEATRYMLLSSAKNMFSTAGYQVYTFFDSRFRVNCLIGSETGNQGGGIEEILGALKSRFQFLTEASLCAGIGRTVTTPQDLYLSYEEAERAYLRVQENNEDTVALYQNIVTNDKLLFSFNRKADELVYLNLTGKKQEMFNALDTFMERFSDTAEGIGCSKSFAMKLLIRLSAAKERENVDLTFLSAVPGIMSRLYSASSVAEVSGYIVKAIELMENTVQRPDDEKNRLIEQAKQYIATHLDNPALDLNDVSNHVGLSKMYFCKLFHKTQKLNFSNYLRIQRIEKSKELLLTTNLKAYEISQKVGFSSAQYYSSVFKQVVGITPSEYQKQYAGNTVE